MTYAAGQVWTYKTPAGFEASRIIIGAIATCANGQNIICFSVMDAPMNNTNGEVGTITIPFIPMSEDAFTRTVKEQVGQSDPPESFSNGLRAWSEDSRGLSTFTVPFEGLLDRMIAMQMAAIVGKPAA